MKPDSMHYDALRNLWVTDSGRVLTDEDLCESTIDADPSRPELQPTHPRQAPDDPR